MAAAASAGPFAERTAPTTFLTVDFDCVGCRRLELWRGLALLRAEDVLRAEAVVRPELERARLVVPFRLLVRRPDADRLARDCGFLLAMVRLPSVWGRVRSVPEPFTRKHLQRRGQW